MHEPLLLPRPCAFGVLPSGVHYARLAAAGKRVDVKRLVLIQ
jgi:hypothetical protein